MPTPRLVKTVPIELDRTRHLRLTLADALAFKRATTTEDRPGGISLLRGDLAHVDLSEEEWLELFVACLRHEDPELTVEALAEVMDMGAYRRAMDGFDQLMRDFVPDVPEGAGEDGDPPTAA